jgi:hypothetical protein
MTSNAKGTTFPTLKPADILQCMGELQVPLSEDELANPATHRETVRRVFEQLVELCTGTAREEMSQMPFDATQMLEYASLHEDSIPHLAFLRASQRMMAACGVHDFSVKDLVTPEAKRFRRQLSGVINFAKFREEQLATFTELTMQVRLRVESTTERRLWTQRERVLMCVCMRAFARMSLVLWWAENGAHVGAGPRQRRERSAAPAFANAARAVRRGGQDHHRSGGGLQKCK